MGALLAAVGILLSLSAAIILIEARRDSRTICASCGLQWCDGQSCAVWDIGRAEPEADPLAPWRAFVESLEGFL